MAIKDTIINACLETLEKKEVKEQFKNLLKPAVDLLMKEIYPYIYLSIVLVFISFLLILGIFILLMRNNNFCVSKMKIY